jgi:cell division inhibitor SulA
MQPNLQRLIEQGVVWQGQTKAEQTTGYVKTGFSKLDELLGGGWQTPGLHEWQLNDPFSEQRLLLPLAQQAIEQGLAVFWVNPPAQLSAAGLHYHELGNAMHIVVEAKQSDACWALEQILRTKNTMAFAWLSQKETTASNVRRWYKAAESGQTGIVITEFSHNLEARPYSNRLKVRLTEGGFALDILKRKSGWPVENIELK